MRHPTLTTWIGESLGSSEWLLQASESFLLAVGDAVASTDYAVTHYTDPWHKQFFGQRHQLIHAIRRHDSWIDYRNYMGRLESLVHHWQRRWDQPNIPPIRDQILGGCDDFRQWFAAQPSQLLFNLLFDAVNRSSDHEGGDLMSVSITPHGQSDQTLIR
ncbi:hypothetical protein [Sulfobacillus harzensis]|uniref:Uncharacterized protein n=1 Tax=Sulfobacillus harzensis TaxID=2729629 RepID=A0A7Y0Q2R7_9FIRM|nr:hypothetical protein [Sulfobacillus harzensis]NMP22640.1 hypothetical protein [Sulfobacillus harzensis]